MSEIYFEQAGQDLTSLIELGGKKLRIAFCYIETAKKQQRSRLKKQLEQIYSNNSANKKKVTKVEINIYFLVLRTHTCVCCET